MLVLKKVACQVQVSSPRISKPAMTAGRATCGPTEMLPPPILLVTRPCPGEAFASQADSSDVSAAAEATEPAPVVRHLVRVEPVSEPFSSLLWRIDHDLMMVPRAAAENSEAPGR